MPHFIEYKGSFRHLQLSVTGSSQSSFLLYTLFLQDSILLKLPVFHSVLQGFHAEHSVLKYLIDPRRFGTGGTSSLESYRHRLAVIRRRLLSGIATFHATKSIFVEKLVPCSSNFPRTITNNSSLTQVHSGFERTQSVHLLQQARWAIVLCDKIRTYADARIVTKGKQRSMRKLCTFIQSQWLNTKISGLAKKGQKWGLFEKICGHNISLDIYRL
jgi:hypothetical protein